MNGHAYSIYQHYKDSGVEWLGKIPERWELIRADHILKRENRPADTTEEVVTCFRDGQVTLRSKRRSDGYTFALKEIGYQGIRKGDLVVHAMDAFAGAIGISDSDGKGSPVYSVCSARHPDATCLKYTAYLLREMARSSYIRALSKGIRERSTDFRYGEFKRVFLCQPPGSEQTAIAAFLDRETARIDALIEKQERLIEKLEEKRKALISRAVTQGLNPNVKMKDSGVEWLGKIPEHWGVVALGHFARLGNGSTPLRERPEYWAGGSFPWLNSSVVNELVIGPASQFVTDIALNECHLPVVRPGSVLVALTGEGKTRGMAALLTYSATINQHLAYITPRESVCAGDFLRESLAARYEMLRFVSDGGGSTKGALTCDMLKRFKIPVPPLVEQRTIVEHLRTHNRRFGENLASVQNLIENLRERRTALISAAVTGKIDVREVANG